MSADKNAVENAGKGRDGLIYDEITGGFIKAFENDMAARWHNLADPRLGARALSTSDEWFAPKERLLDPGPAILVPNKFDDHGKWMDGWETRRRRGPGHDHCIVKLASAGKIFGANIDTTHFTGNFPSAISIEAAYVEDGENRPIRWEHLLEPVAVKGDCHNLFDIKDENIWTHIRLNIYPDGGVARLRIYGEICRDWDLQHSAPVDLLAIENGGWLVDCSDQHWGSPANITYPGTGANMGEGWETVRRREPGNEWALFRLAHPGSISRIIVDTTHFKGNYPDRCSIQAAAFLTSEAAAVPASMFWYDLLAEQKLEMDKVHTFEKEILHSDVITHIRFNVIPDGGVNRLRLFGVPSAILSEQIVET